MSDTHEHGTPAHAGGHGHAEAEADRANVGAIGLLLAATAIVLAIASYMLWVYFQREAEAVNYTQVLSQPSSELQALRAKEAEWLGTYGVVNKEQGLYRVPVEVGAKLFLQQAAARRTAGQPQVLRAPPPPPAPEGEEQAAPGAGQQ
jgi:hypothetical protein